MCKPWCEMEDVTNLTEQDKRDIKQTAVRHIEGSTKYLAKQSITQKRHLAFEDDH